MSRPFGFHQSAQQRARSRMYMLQHPRPANVKAHIAHLGGVATRGLPRQRFVYRAPRTVVALAIEWDVDASSLRRICRSGRVEAFKQRDIDGSTRWWVTEAGVAQLRSLLRR